ncbi:hypothetical protein E3N88_40483 [Mikania micrantha]|uniref:Uncharacterized protein n=1 Tax=Mikania micrantha TaxID=192012 RepID=A0A5N6LMY9_9ASTR|nr:hypothetical protein E3N88_40483 [Mikania micrantha]
MQPNPLYQHITPRGPAIFAAARPSGSQVLPSQSSIDPLNAITWTSIHKAYPPPAQSSIPTQPPSTTDDMISTYLTIFTLNTQNETSEQMKNYEATENENTTIDSFLVVMNKESYGYRRLYGRGVTNTLLKKVEGPSTSYMITEGLMESFKANVDVEKNQ